MLVDGKLTGGIDLVSLDIAAVVAHMCGVLSTSKSRGQQTEAASSGEGIALSGVEMGPVLAQVSSRRHPAGTR